MATNAIDVVFRGSNSGLTKAIAEIRKDLATLKDSRVKVAIDVDQATIQKLKADLAALKNHRVKIAVDVDQAAIQRLKADLAFVRNQTVRVRTTGDTSGLKARSAAVQLSVVGAAAAETIIARVARDRTAKIHIDTDTSKLAAIAVSTREVDRSLKSAGRSGPGALSKIATSASKAVKPLALVAAGSLAVGASAGAGPALLVAGLGAVTVAAGMASVAITGGIAGGFIYAAAQSEVVQAKYKKLGEEVGTAFKEISKPIELPLRKAADGLSDAFKSMRPNLEAISQGTAGLVDTFTDTLPAIGEKLGPALEKAFGAGVPHMENMIGLMPRYAESFGNVMEKLGDPRVVDVANKFFSALPGWLEKGAAAIPKMAGKVTELMDSFKDGGSLEGFATGIGKLWDNVKDADWSKLADGLKDAANNLGDLLGNVDIDSLAENLGTVAETIATVISTIDSIGVGNTIGIALGVRLAGSIIGGVVGELGKNLLKKMAAKIAGAFAAKALTDIAVKGGGAVAGGFIDGLTSGISSFIGNGLGRLIGNLFGDLLAPDLKGDYNVDDIKLPEDIPPLVGVFEVSEILMPEVPVLPPVILPVTFDMGALDTETGQLHVPIIFDVPAMPPMPTFEAVVVPVSMATPTLPEIPTIPPVVVQVTMATPVLPAMPTIPPVVVPVEGNTAPLTSTLGTLGTIFFRGGASAVQVPVEGNTNPFMAALGTLASVASSAKDVWVDVAGRIREITHTEALGDTIIDVVGKVANVTGLDSIPMPPPISLPTEWAPTPPPPVVVLPPFLMPIEWGPLPAMPVPPTPPPVLIPVSVDAAGAQVDLTPQGAAAGASFAAGLSGQAGAISAAAEGMAAGAKSMVVDLNPNGTAAGASFAAGLSGQAGAVSGAAQSMANAARSVSVDLSGAGAAAGNSFAAGLSSASGAVASAAAGLGATAKANKGHYKGLRGMAADRIMLRENGQAMVGGFIWGMNDQEGALISASARIARVASAQFDEALSPKIGLAGAMTMEQNVRVEIDAGMALDPVKAGREFMALLDAYAGAVGASSTTVVSV